MKRNVKKLQAMLSMLLVLCMSIINLGTIQANAAEVEEELDYVIINGTEVIYEGQDYYNEETGEYFFWGKGRGIDKEFTYKVRYSVTSSKFTVNGKTVTVDSSACITYDNAAVNYGSFDYYIYLNGLYSRKLAFNVTGTESGTISGLVNGGKYTVTISTGEELPDNYYLEGSGTITS